MDLATVGYLIGGLVLLVIGAEALVRGSANLARRLGVGPLVVGLTVVAFGTSAPELVVSLRAAVAGSGDIALGNVVGSNIVNILLILGLAALIRPLAVQAQVVRLDIPIMIGISLLVVPLLLDGRLGRVEGAALVAAIVGYTVLSVWLARREKQPLVQDEFAAGLPAWPRGPLAETAAIVIGLSLLAGGASLFVRGAVAAAEALGVDEALIGLTVVAVGTSLPELMTSVLAALRRESDIAVGNIVGSNIFNLLAILGTGSLVHPIRAEGIVLADYLVMLGAALVLLPFAWSQRRLNRWEAAALLLGYAVYVALRGAWVPGS